MGSWDAEAAMSRCILKQSERQRNHPRYRGRGGDGPGGDLLGNDLFLTLAAQKAIEEISAMLPPEAMKLIELAPGPAQRGRGRRRSIKGGFLLCKSKNGTGAGHC